MFVSPWMRARVWLRRNALDHELAAGADPSSSPELACRAAELASLGHRRSLANAIEGALEAAERPARRLSPQIPVHRREVLITRPQLLQLADDLAGEGNPGASDRGSISGKRPALLRRFAAALSLRGMASGREQPREADEASDLGLRGIALAECLLTDGDSPLYLPHPDGTLDAAVRRARAALLLR